MPEQFHMVLQGTPNSERTAYSVLANAAREAAFTEAIFISPFVTQEGAKMLNGIADEAETKTRLWIAGLDGTITTLQALDEITASKGVTAFGWRQGSGIRYLHAKVFALRSDKSKQLVLYAGSANATQGGLAENIEAGTLLEFSGESANQVGQAFDRWIDELKQEPVCVQLTDEELEAYRKRYREPKGSGRTISRVVGVKKRPRQGMVPTSNESAWIEIAVRGGSNNQVEICKNMAPFFTGGLPKDRVEFQIIDSATGISYPNNAYRFRAGNTGYRVEVDTDLARALDLEAASLRRDIIEFVRTEDSALYIVKLYPARASRTQKLIGRGRAEGRVRPTISGSRGRLYYV